MKRIYKGYEINVTREKCNAGYAMLFFSVYRESDGLEVICDSEDSAEKVNDMITIMEHRIDEFIRSKGESEGLEEFYQEY